MDEVERGESVSRAARVSVEELAKRIGDTFDVSANALAGGGRSRKVSEARSVLCWVWFEHLGRSGRELARYLGLRPQSVYEAARRGAERFEVSDDV